MGEYFKGWRRKAGLVTLLVACLFARFWLQGLSLQESLAVRVGLSKYSVVTTPESFYLTREYNGNPMRTTVDIKSVALSAPTLVHQAIHENSIFWKWRRFGFGLYDCTLEDIDYRLTLFRVPYRSIALSLTVLTIWLLLSKQKRRNPTRVDGSTPLPKT